MGDKMKKYDKKAQGLSMSTIVIAAIAILILVVLTTLILTGTINVKKGMSCGGIQPNAECYNGPCSELGENYLNGGIADCEEGFVCCYPVTP